MFRHNRKIICALLSFFIPVIIMMVVNIISRFYPFGKYSILMADMRYQYVDYYGYLKNVFKYNDSFAYSFTKSIGSGMHGFLAYYCSNPFLIILMFIPLEDLPAGILIMMMLMIGTMGFTFNKMIREIYGSRLTSVIFSTAYSLCGYVTGYFCNVQFLFNLVVLPLVVLGIYRIIKNEKISKLYIISQAISIIGCYYIGYMICLFSVYMFVYYYCINFSNIKNTKKTILIFIQSSIVSCMIAAPNLLSAIGSLQSQSRTTIVLKFINTFNLRELLSGLYFESFNGDISTGIPLIYCGIIPVIFMIMFFANRRIDNIKKIMSLEIIFLIIVSFYIKSINTIWHGLSEPVGFPYRNSFMLSFIILIISYEGYIHLKNELSKVIIYTSAILYLIYSVYLYISKSKYVELHQIIITSIIIVICSITIYMYKNEILNKNILITLCVIYIIECTSNTYTSLNKYFPDKENDKTIEISAFKDFIDETGTIIERLNISDNALCRIEKLYRRTHNDSMLLGYNGVSHFSSVESDKTKRIIGDLGYRDNGNWAFYSYGSDSFADSLLGVKYLLSQYDTIGKPYELVDMYSNKYVFRNNYALPFVFSVNSTINDIDSTKYNKFEYQNEIAKQFDGFNDTIYKPVKNITVKEVNIIKDDNKYKIKDKSKEAYIEYSFINERDNYIYMYFDADDIQDTKIIVNDLEKQSYFTQYDWCIREMCYYNIGDSISLKLYLEQDEITINDYQFYYEDTEALEKWYEITTNNPCELSKVRSNFLTGNITLQENQTVVFSIPYNSNWKVKVDDKTVETFETLNGLLAIKPEHGAHVVSLRYSDKLFRLGLIFAILGIAATITSTKKQR